MSCAFRFLFVVLERDTQALGASLVEEEFHRWHHPQKVLEVLESHMGNPAICSS